MPYFGTVLGGKHVQQEERSETMELVYMDGRKEPYTTSEIIAECAEVQHHTITRLVRDNKADFEALRILGFKIHKLDKRGQPKKSIF